MKGLWPDKPPPCTPLMAGTVCVSVSVCSVLGQKASLAYCFPFLCGDKGPPEFLLSVLTLNIWFLRERKRLGAGQEQHSYSVFV